MRTIVRRSFIALLFAAFGLSASTGYATIVISNPNGNTPGLTGINLDNLDDVAIVTGSAFGTDFFFTDATTSNGDGLISSNGGVATITAGGANTSTFTALTLTPEAGFGATGLAFRVQAPANSGGSITIVALDQFGNAYSETFDLVNGQNNYFAEVTDAVQLITSLSFTTTVGLNTASQFEVGGVQEIPSTAVPEPSTIALAALGGLGLLGLARRRA
jgi:hypothetical protein